MQVFDPPDGVNREILIGYAINTTTMYPNSNYFRFHAKEWNTLHPDALYMTCPNTLKVGLYSLVLGAAQCEGIYEDIAKVRGVRDANMIMDYIMFLISEKKNATYLMSGALSDQVTFTGLPYSDSAYSKMFSNPMNENYSRAILDLWLQRCIANGMESVYLVIDGSNDDCDAIENELAEPGDAKSHRSGPVMGFIWAVQANGENAGLPVSYFLNKGGIIDARAVNQVCEYFKAFNVKVEGAICDRGFCDLESLKLFLNAKLPYVVMLKKNIKGFKNMVNEHGAGIRTYSNYTKAHMYGVTGETELFKDSGFSSRVALFFDPIKEAFTEIGLMDKIIEAEENIKENIRKGLRASVPRGLRKYMHIEGKGKERVVVIKEELISGDMKMAGFLGIATFKEMTPEQAIIVYNFRMIVEQAFSYFKSQLSDSVFSRRVQV